MWPALKGKREPGMESVDTTINALELFVSMHNAGDVGHSLLCTTILRQPSSPDERLCKFRDRKAGRGRLAKVRHDRLT